MVFTGPRQRASQCLINELWSLTPGEVSCSLRQSAFDCRFRFSPGPQLALGCGIETCLDPAQSRPVRIALSNAFWIRYARTFPPDWALGCGHISQEPTVSKRYLQL